MTDLPLFNVAGLRFTFRPSALVGSVLLWVVFSLGAALVLSMPLVTAILFGLGATLIHWLSEIWHNFGHAWAARRAGYPMTGARLGLYFVFAQSLYPPYEPPLPARIHVQRALGGPLASAVLTLITGLIAYGLWPAQDLIAWLAAFACLENLFVFTLQAVLPLGFNDGATLWRWLSKK